MKWINFSLKSPYEYEDLIYNYLYENEVYSFEVVDDRTVDEVEETKPYWVEIDNDLRIGEEYLYIKFNLEDNEENFDKITNLIDNLNRLSSDIKTEYKRDCEEYDWTVEWKKFFKPLEVGEKFVIVPSWEEYKADKDKIILEIDPGMAFGTGSHETTAICLKLLEEVDIKDKIVADVGTGSGILAIACSKIGAKHVLALDIDPLSIKTAKENVVVNDCVDKIEVMESDLLSTSKDSFDLIIANILPDVIINLIPDAYEKLNEKGLILVSGIILEKKDLIIKELKQHGFSIVKDLDMGEWTGIIGRKDV
ncbi:50S ribosomal protein L11 methyltransferase [Lagierella massiliensis]|uniref:50S ribosomal protein L11 methyltransferase n=1 Tax=Lagierella massiliensis TaxID=1689303 RepID=UPI0006D7D856|nr:50S ribosomal protein L11 methyltransferase [Lagierella massiliensis]